MRLYTHVQLGEDVADIDANQRFEVINGGIRAATDEELLVLSQKLPRRNGNPRKRVSVLVGLSGDSMKRLDGLRRRYPDASMSALFYRLLAAHLSGAAPFEIQ